MKKLLIVLILFTCSCSQRLVINNVEVKQPKNSKEQKKDVNMVIASYFIGFLIVSRIR